MVPEIHVSFMIQSGKKYFKNDQFNKRGNRPKDLTLEWRYDQKNKNSATTYEQFSHTFDLKRFSTFNKEVD